MSDVKMRVDPMFSRYVKRIKYNVHRDNNVKMSDTDITKELAMYLETFPISIEKRNRLKSKHKKSIYENPFDIFEV